MANRAISRNISVDIPSFFPNRPSSWSQRLSPTLFSEDRVRNKRLYRLPFPTSSNSTRKRQSSRTASRKEVPTRPWSSAKLIWIVQVPGCQWPLWFSTAHQVVRGFRTYAMPSTTPSRILLWYGSSGFRSQRP